MSLKMMVRVMEEVEITRPQQTILLAMADHADDDGKKCFPSIDRIAWKTGYKPRAVEDIIRELRKIKILVEVNPAAQWRPIEYEIHLEEASPKMSFEEWREIHGKHKNKRGAKTAPLPRGAISRDSGVQSRVQITRETAPEPSVEPSEKEHTLDTPNVVSNGRAQKGSTSESPETTPRTLEEVVFDYLMTRVRRTPLDKKVTQIQVGTWKRELGSRINVKSQDRVYVWALAEEVIAAARAGWYCTFKKAEQRIGQRGGLKESEKKTPEDWRRFFGLDEVTVGEEANVDSLSNVSYEELRKALVGEASPAKLPAKAQLKLPGEE